MLQTVATIFESGTFWTAVGSVATVIAAVVAVIALTRHRETQPGGVHGAAEGPRGFPMSAAEPMPALKPLSCEDEHTIRSKRSYSPTSIEIANNGSSSLSIFWINETGRRHPFGHLAPGEVAGFSTFVGHAWLLADDAGECLAVYVADSQPSRANAIAGSGSSS
jgi:hypothetical protein